jgi:hypothetical protein
MTRTVIKAFNIAAGLIIFGWCLAANAADESSFDKVWNYANPNRHLTLTSNPF